ncbi:MAG: hypothetical protein ACO3BB_02235 [Bacilli bacterium]|jgi:hypothetical protein
MKQKITAYAGLVFFAALFGFLIWGLVNLLSQFSVQENGLFTFLSVIIPNAIALGFIGFYLVIYILKVKKLPPKLVPPVNDAKPKE